MRRTCRKRINPQIRKKIRLPGRQLQKRRSRQERRRRKRKKSRLKPWKRERRSRLPIRRKRQSRKRTGRLRRRRHTEQLPDSRKPRERADRPEPIGAARDRRFTDRGKQALTARGGPGRRQADRPEELIPERERLRPGSPRALRNPAEQPQKEQPGEDRYKGREDRPRTRGDRRQAELRERKGQLRAGRQAQKTYSPAVQLRAEALPSSSLEAPGRLCREICLRETGSLIHGSPSRLRVCIPREELRDMEITVYGKRPERPCILPCSVLWLFCTPLF